MSYDVEIKKAFGVEIEKVEILVLGSPCRYATALLVEKHYYLDFEWAIQKETSEAAIKTETRKIMGWGEFDGDKKTAWKYGIVEFVTTTK